FDLVVRDALLILFFTTIGLNARFADLLRGGPLLITLLVLTIVFMLLQNGVGLLGATLFGLPSELSVLLGTASLIGGHGTAIAWGPEIELISGFEAAEEIGLAAATLGLIVAALVGGPLAKFLIDKHDLHGDDEAAPMVGLEYEKPDEEAEVVNHISLMRSLLTIHIAVLLGFGGFYFFNQIGLMLPSFVPCLLAGVLLSNTVPYLLPRVTWPARTRAMAVISDYCLSVFLAMSLMSMQLWTLSELGLTLVVVLLMQVVLAVVFIIGVLFVVLRRTYTAAVLSAGFAGFVLGATPTAIANMSSVAKRYGPAPLAFITLPLVSAFFVDLANAVIIQFFVSL
ncbi:MAG: sodium/glutamate symporter, partial [Pseudomonadota bacterium]